VAAFLFACVFHPISALLSGNFLQNTQPDSYPPYSQRPIKKTGGVQHNDFIDNATASTKRPARANTERSQAMNNDQILMEIRETNLSYLMLAQSLIRLGLSEEAAERISALSPAQVLKIASSNTLICRMRIDDDMVWGLLTNHGKASNPDNVALLHANILMAGRHQEAA
jgi:flagellar transcriptional activator FlhD